MPCTSNRICNADNFSCFLGDYRILVLASAVFFYGESHVENGGPASLFDVYDLIRDVVGPRELSDCLPKLTLTFPSF